MSENKLVNMAFQELMSGSFQKGDIHPSVNRVCKTMFYAGCDFIVKVVLSNKDIDEDSVKSILGELEDYLAEIKEKIEKREKETIE